MRVALTTLAALSLSGTAVQASQLITQTEELSPETEVSILNKAPEPKEPRFICKGCNENESLALEYFQNVGIKDKNALAVILGNIRQESTFISNICEGGLRTSYHRCRAGGFGLIQFTSSDRYYGLGQFARQVGGDPSTTLTQLQYMTTEPQWRLIENRMKATGKTVENYMRYAYSWIGWGIHGARTSYAYSYLQKLVPDTNS